MCWGCGWGGECEWGGGLRDNSNLLKISRSKECADRVLFRHITSRCLQICYDKNKRQRP